MLSLLLLLCFFLWYQSTKLPLIEAKEGSAKRGKPNFNLRDLLVIQLRQQLHYFPTLRPLLSLFCHDSRKKASDFIDSDLKDSFKDDEYEQPSVLSHFQEDANKPLRIPTLPTFLEAHQLDGTNYSLSKVQMAAVLKSYDLAEFITIGVFRPTPADDPQAALMWDKLHAHVHSFIFLNCQPTVLNHIK